MEPENKPEKKMSKLLQVRVSKKLHDDLEWEAVMLDIPISQLVRLKLKGKQIVDKKELEADNKPKFKPIQ